MRTIILMLTALLSASSFSITKTDCYSELKSDAIEKVAKTLEIDTTELKARYIGGENLDGDLTSDGLYYSPSYEYVDVFFKNDDTSTTKAIDMFLVLVSAYSDRETEEIVECELGAFKSVPTSDWSEIYNGY